MEDSSLKAASYCSSDMLMTLLQHLPSLAISTCLCAFLFLQIQTVTSSSSSDIATGIETSRAVFLTVRLLPEPAVVENKIQNRSCFGVLRISLDII